MLDNLSLEEAKKALKAAIELFELDLECDYCKLEKTCQGIEIYEDLRKTCRDYILKRLLENPEDLRQHIICSNLL